MFSRITIVNAGAASVMRTILVTDKLKRGRISVAPIRLAAPARLIHETVAEPGA